jgi:hypothetical protein
VRKVSFSILHNSNISGISQTACGGQHTEWFLMNLMRSRLRASPRPAHRQPRSAREFCRWLSMPTTFWTKGSSYISSQITGGVENAVPLHVDIPRTGGRGFDLPSGDAMQEYLKFSYECFLSVLPFEGYCCKLCPSQNRRRKKSQGSLPLSKHSTLMFCFLIY